MKKIKLLPLSIAFMCLTACGTRNNPTSELPEVDDTVDVFVLSGQSNMEGSTYYDNGEDWLRKAMQELELDSEPCFDGIDNVLTSYYGYYPYGGSVTPNASNKENPLEGEFLTTKVGMGNNSKDFGPELGLAYQLAQRANDDRPIYLIKCAFSGSGFNKSGENWIIDPNFKGPSGYQGTYSATQNLYDNKLKPFVENNLKIIEETGKTPVIKGFLWHQGESDANNQIDVDAYADLMPLLISQFREDFAEYAIEEDGDNISFIDALIYDGTRLTYGAVDKLNDLKIQIAESHDNNYVINTSTRREGGMKLEIGGHQNIGGCDNIYHYTTIDCFRLGMAYADVILENILD